MKNLILIAILLTSLAHAEETPKIPLNSRLLHSSKISVKPLLSENLKSKSTTFSRRPPLNLEKGTIVQKLNNNAMGGSEGTGGGDLCEDRIKVIRDDIKSWIKKSGAQGLTLPQGFTPPMYASTMLEALDSAKIRCVGSQDKDFPVEINGTPKVCKFIRSQNGSQITCDLSKFQSMNESDQYVLIHHEYAGISGIEIPNGDDSNYEVSNQISSYLEETMVKRLSVKKKTPIPLKVGKLIQAYPGQAYVLGQTLHITQQAYGLTISGQTFYRDTPLNWYAVFDESMPANTGIYFAKGKLQVVYNVEDNASQGILCEYDIQIALVLLGENTFVPSYQFPVTVPHYLDMPGGKCPAVNTNTIWSSDKSYNWIQK